MSKVKAVCPVCSKAKYASEMSYVMNWMIQNNKLNYPMLKDLNAYDSFINASFEWACDECLKTKKAIKAHPALQITSADPHLAYGDSPFVCTNCKRNTHYKKEEKLFWYEELKFPIHASPDKCLDCRRTERKNKDKNTQLSELLSEGEEGLTSEQLVQIIEIYLAWENEEKAKYYQAKLKKIEKSKNQEH